MAPFIDNLVCAQGGLQLGEDALLTVELMECFVQWDVCNVDMYGLGTHTPLPTYRHNNTDPYLT